VDEYNAQNYTDKNKETKYARNDAFLKLNVRGMSLALIWCTTELGAT
jgi:hypothetical protein